MTGTEWTTSVKWDHPVEVTAISAKSDVAGFYLQPFLWWCSNHSATGLRQISIQWMRLGTSRLRSNGAILHSPVPDDMTWHAGCVCMAAHGAECDAEKSTWMCQSGCRQSHWLSETSLPSKCLLHSLTVIEKQRSCFSRLVPCTLLFMKQFCRQGNSKQAGRPQFVSASRLRCR